MDYVDDKTISEIVLAVANAKLDSRANVAVQRCLLEELLRGYTWALKAGYTGAKE